MDRSKDDQGRGHPDGSSAVVDDRCLTRRGFIEMYRCMWQAAGRDIEVSGRSLGPSMLSPCSGPSLCAPDVARFVNRRHFSGVGEPGVPCLVVRVRGGERKSLDFDAEEWVSTTVSGAVDRATDG